MAAAQQHSWDATRTASTVRFVYCPSCGGKRTQKLVWNGDEDASPDAWYRYESEGLNELRVDERYDSQTDGNAVLDANDPWRTLRYTVHGPGQISHEIKETKFTYFGAGAEPVSSTTFYYHFDALGNVLGLSDTDGALLETYRMDAFGVDQNDWTQDTYTTRRITGKEYDRDVGLYDFRARWYDPHVGQFTSRDPVSHRRSLDCAAHHRVGGSPCTDYAFCRLAPTHFFDPDGARPQVFDYQQCILMCLEHFDSSGEVFTHCLQRCSGQQNELKCHVTGTPPLCSTLIPNWKRTYLDGLIVAGIPTEDLRPSSHKAGITEVFPDCSVLVWACDRRVICCPDFADSNVKIPPSSHHLHELWKKYGCD